MNINHTIKSYMHKTGVHTACQIADSFYGSTPDPVLGLCSPSNMPYPWKLPGLPSPSLAI